MAFTAAMGHSLALEAAECAPASTLSTCIDIDEVWVKPGNSLFLTGGGGVTTPEGSAAFGLSTSYSRRPLVLLAFGADADPREVYVVENLLTTTFAFALGVTDKLELTAALPVTFYQDGAGYAAYLGSDQELTRSVLRDPRFGFGYAFLQRERTADASGLGLVARFEFSMPLGDETQFAGVRGGTFNPAVSASYRLPPFEAKLDVEGRIRPEEAMANVVFGTQLGITLGANVEVYQPLGLSFSAEAIALPSLVAQGDEAAALVPGEWLASARIAPFLAGDIYFQAGAGTGIPFTDSSATSPQLRVVGAFGYAPRGIDSDGDRVLDREDQCVDKAEDRDGFQDADGCPDPDNDKDGILDGADRCRDDAETTDGFQDEDGCPDLDDDLDEIPDDVDACRNDREDLDGFEDEDGCPDPDNDKDGVVDGKDLCPKDAEDKDSFQDDDGCPEGDNDRDGIPDGVDRCPREPEDKDSFQDEDGCADPDNDLDGVLDPVDRCPNDAETLDGVQDEDGCPEANSKSLAKLKNNAFEFTDVPAFAPGRSELTPALTKLAKVVAGLAKAQKNPTRIVIEGYGDRRNDAAGERLGSARALAFKRALMKEGIAERAIAAVAGDPAGSRTEGAHLDVAFAPDDSESE